MAKQDTCYTAAKGQMDIKENPSLIMNDEYESKKKKLTFKNLVKKALQLREAAEEYGDSKDFLKDRVVLDVSGVRHETLLKTMLSKPNTHLGTIALSAKATGQREFFFDRDPQLFPYVLGYYRDNALHLPSNVCGAMLKAELEYWEIDDTEIEQCCYLHYTNFEETLDMLKKLKEYEVNLSLMDTVDDKDSRWQRNRAVLWKKLQNPYSSKGALIYAMMALVIMMVSILVFVLETIPYFESVTLKSSKNISSEDLRREMDIFHDLSPSKVLSLLDNICNVFFLAEFSVKVIAAPLKVKFLVQPLSIIEVTCLIPFYLGTMLIYLHPDPVTLFDLIRVLFAFRALRIFRIFALMNHFMTLRVLVNAVVASTYELLLLLLVLVIGVVVFACLEFYVELFLSQSATQFEHIPIAFWWAVVTMTTVGYGDIVPSTSIGYIIGALCAISGVLIVALSVPSIVNSFTLYCTLAQTREKLKQRKTANFVRKSKKPVK